MIIQCIHICSIWTWLTLSRITIQSSSRWAYTILSLFLQYSGWVAFTSTVCLWRSESRTITCTILTLTSRVYATNFSSTLVTALIYGVCTKTITFSISIHGISRCTCAIKPSSRLFTVRYSGTYIRVTIMSRIWTSEHTGAVCQIFISKSANTCPSTVSIWNITVRDICTLPLIGFLTIEH